jgi:putative methionine-R-sulfoxide reductase with GAF domain
MLSAIRNFFLSPVYEGDPEKTQDARTTHRISVALLGLAIFSVPFIFLLEPPIKEYALGATIFSLFLWLLTIFLVKREQGTIAKIIILVVNTVILYAIIFATGGLTQPTVITLLFLLAMANLLFPRRGAIYYGLVILVLVSVLYILGVAGLTPNVPPPATTRPTFFTFLFTLISVAIALWVASSNYLRILDAVRKNESEFREKNIELNQLRATLEQRVSERTTQLEKRAGQFEAISTVASSISALNNVDELLPAIARLVIESFGFYHTGIFLLDKTKEFAVLTASPTEAGRQMIANRHKLRVGEVGIVGRVASTGEPRITLDTGLDAIHFNNPFLPNTRSEMALPLKVKNEIIGVLDVQSDQSQAFNDDDIIIMQTLADQLATAIERTRLLQQVEENFKELEKAYGRTTSDSWKSLAESGLVSNFGYRFDNTRIQPISEITDMGVEAMSSGQIISNDSKSKGWANKHETAIPIKLRGQSIGVVTVKLKEGHNASSIDTIKQAVDRLAGSLESARLFEEARLRADREQAIAQVTSSISAANEFDAILRTTVEEIGKSLGQAEVSIQIANDADERQD